MTTKRANATRIQLMAAGITPRFPTLALILTSFLASCSHGGAVKLPQEVPGGCRSGRFSVEDRSSRPWGAEDDLMLLESTAQCRKRYGTCILKFYKFGEKSYAVLCESKEIPFRP